MKHEETHRVSIQCQHSMSKLKVVQQAYTLEPRLPATAAAGVAGTLCLAMTGFHMAALAVLQHQHNNNSCHLVSCLGV
jgi:hypothetical protein